MGTKKVSECISVRINVGNYQHIEITKYAEEQISYNSATERIAEEDRARDELIDSLKRSMEKIPEALKRGMKEAIQVEESIQKRIPAWLEENAVPNIANANQAQTRVVQIAAEQEDDKCKAVAAESVDIDEIIPPSAPAVKNEVVALEEVVSETSVAIEDGDDVADLYASDDVDEVINASPAKEEPAKEEPKKDKKAIDSDGFDVFDQDDDDLFG